MSGQAGCSSQGWQLGSSAASPCGQSGSRLAAGWHHKPAQRFNYLVFVYCTDMALQAHRYYFEVGTSLLLQSSTAANAARQPSMGPRAPDSSYCATRVRRIQPAVSTSSTSRPSHTSRSLMASRVRPGSGPVRQRSLCSSQLVSVDLPCGGKAGRWPLGQARQARRWACRARGRAGQDRQAGQYGGRGRWAGQKGDVSRAESEGTHGEQVGGDCRRLGSAQHAHA